MLDARRMTGECKEPYLEVIKEKLLESFRDEENFGFMKGYEPWENLIYKS